MPKPGTLTKAHIIDAVIEQNGYTRKKSIETVEILLELIKQSLVSGEDVLISGFGKFCVNQKSKRRGRNPATGKDMMLRRRKVVTFKCSGKLRETLNRRRTKAKKRREKENK
jgi:integration host factor subunit alpha